MENNVHFLNKFMFALAYLGIAGLVFLDTVIFLFIIFTLSAGVDLLNVLYLSVLGAIWSVILLVIFALTGSKSFVNKFVFALAYLGLACLVFLDTVIFLFIISMLKSASVDLFYVLLLSALGTFWSIILLGIFAFKGFKSFERYLLAVCTVLPVTTLVYLIWFRGR
jgi:hypothetical protein